MCVKIVLSKPLIPAYTLKGKNYKVEYEFIHYLCFNCGKVGHWSELCREKPSTGVQSPATPTTGKANGMVNNENCQGRTGSNGNINVGNGKNGESVIHTDMVHSENISKDTFGLWMMAQPKYRKKYNQNIHKKVET